MESIGRLLTTAQAAAALGVKVDTVRHAIQSKALPAEKLGRQWVVTPEAVDAYRAGHLGGKGWKATRRNKGAQ